MRATATPQENNRVLLEVEVPSADMDAAVDEAARRLSREVNIKGFRKGKAPRQVIEARLGGKSALRAEALREALPDFFAKAVSEALVDPIDQPAITVTGGEESGDLTFEATVDVRPEVDLVGYRALEVTIPSPVVRDDEIAAQVDRMRETDAELTDVDRPVQKRDLIVADVTRTDPSGEKEPVVLEDYSYEVGSGGLAMGIDEMLLGHSAGETVEAAGRIGVNDYAAFAITIKAVRERLLPELTDEWVAENTDYESVDALTDAVREQLRRRKIVEAQFAQRDALMAAAADLVDVEAAPSSLVEREVGSRIEELQQRLLQRGINVEYFLQISGQTMDELVATLRADAVRAVRVDLALRAIARLEGLDPTEDEVEKELADTAASIKLDVEKLRTSLYDNGRTVAFRDEIAKMKATKWLMDHVTYRDEEGIEIDRALLQSDQSTDEEAAETPAEPSDDSAGDSE